jgi:predicted glycosyltransferase
MDLSGKKVWFDVEEPKTAVMFKSLFEMFQNLGLKLLITARDYDSTFQILDDMNVEYYKIGKHGGAKLEEKLKTYIQRLSELLPHVKNFSPHYFVTFSSVEGTRIAYGLKIPSIGYNDEPRNEPVCKLIFPFLDNIITPQCIPVEWYFNLGANPKKIIRYNGIDEIAWLSDYSPNSQVLDKFDLEKGKYILMRSEPSFASYFIEKLKPEETMISQIFPSIYKEFPNHKYFLLVRTEKQEQYLRNKITAFSGNKNVVITRYLPNLVDLCFYSALIISGGGTIVRESSLLNVPSIEFFPGETAPQEHFLIKNGFPLEHIRDINMIVERSKEILNEGPLSNRFNFSFREEIKQFQNPNEICFEYVKERLNLQNL